ncbi:hypothetical protein GCM10010468_44540 [Actinocorallia longicatena]|uniref:TVP38/TMEM64 family membrane protein n=1 Tax=Actinocorallia longicatena TaxID=111803 RepID=A0ABP6QGC1_9ACTN
MRFGSLVAVAAVAAPAALFLMPDREVITDFVAGAGAFGPVLAVAGTWLLTLALFPRTALAFVGGVLFGLGPGAFYVLVGALLGAATAFAAGRVLGREFLEERLAGEGRIAVRLARLDGWLGAHGVLGVLSLRLLPVAPYGLVSYAFGTSATRFRDFMAGSALGAIPTTLGYAALGASVLSSSALPLTLGILSGLGLLSLFVAFRLRRAGTPRSPETAETG